MSPPRAGHLAWSLLGLSFVVGALSVVLFPAIDTTDRVGHAAGVIAWLAAGLVGALIASRRPENPIGWLLCVSGLAFVANLGLGLALFAERAAPGLVWLAVLVTWFGKAVAQIPFFLWVTVVLMLFPTGSPPSPRWRGALWAGGATIGANVLRAALLPGPLDPIHGLAIHNPFGLDGAGDLLEFANGVVSGILLLFFGAGIAAAFVRYRRAQGIERKQLQWFAYATCLAFASVVAAIILTPVNLPIGATTILVAFGFASVPVAMGVAILRYRLYEIDRLINRTLVYATLTALLGLTYWLVVVALQTLLRPFTQGSELAIVGSTLAVAALFQPARRWIQAVVDRRFNRRRYDAQRITEAFGSRLRQEVGLNNLSSELLAVVYQTVQPERATLWLRPHLVTMPERLERTTRSE